MSSELARRTAHRLRPDPRRVITKLFVPGEETPRGRSRASSVMDRVLALSEAEVLALTDAVIGTFRGRHHDLAETFSDHFAILTQGMRGPRRISAERRMLIGAFFTHEFAPEAAALCNPSMAPHPDQSGLTHGQLRFVMTVRCVGEGHLSSIGFRTGVLGPGDALVVDEPEPLLVCGTSRPTTYQRRLFLTSLADLGHDRDDVHLLLGGLPETFTAGQLADSLAAIHEHTLHRERVRRTIEHIHRIAEATYDLDFAAATRLTQRLLWPAAPVERQGMEDARLVRFAEDDGTVTYYATYTAFDGRDVQPQLLATQDFQRFHLSPMAGQAARNKGLALFPRRIDGEYVALSRWDRENIAIARSDNCRIWNEPTTIYTPQRGWELIQVGTCGSPIETPAGWLVITHGVGPMRSYVLGAMLLDLAEPATVLATLPEPLLTPNADERDGYVPNVVYSCGQILHGSVLTIPYGISDGAIGFAQVTLTELLSRMGTPARSPRRSANGARPARGGEPDSG